VRRTNGKRRDRHGLRLHVPWALNVSANEKIRDERPAVRRGRTDNVQIVGYRNVSGKRNAGVRKCSENASVNANNLVSDELQTTYSLS
jgi:hypothetical protein